MNHHQDAAERSSSAFARLCDSISYNQQRYNSNDNNQDEPFDHVLLEDILDSETTIEDFLESVQSLETSAPETSPTSNDPSRRKLLGDDGEDQEERIIIFAFLVKFFLQSVGSNRDLCYE